MCLDISSWDFGTVPGWISALSTFLALVAACFAAVFAYHQVKAAQAQVEALKAEARDRAQEKRRELASQVAAWLAKDASDNFVVLILNASKQPVYDAVLSFIAPNNENDMISGTFPPMETPTVHVGMSEFINGQREDVKSIDLSWNLPHQNGTIKTLETQEDGTSKWVEGQWRAGPIGVGITFTDTSGVRWERTIDGRLEERPNGYKVSSSYVMG